MKTWFNNPKSVEELKKQYKKLAIENHPDRGGSTEAMQEINAEYDRLFAKLKDIHTSASGETYTAKEESAETPDEFKDIISRLVSLIGIEIEVCGSWLWVTGATFAHKEILKEMKFRWSKNKNAWYFHNDGYIKRSRKTFSMDEIRDLWGSEKANGNPQNVIGAAN